MLRPHKIIISNFMIVTMLVMMIMVMIMVIVIPYYSCVTFEERQKYPMLIAKYPDRNRPYLHPLDTLF